MIQRLRKRLIQVNDIEAIWNTCRAIQGTFFVLTFILWALRRQLAAPSIRGVAIVGGGIGAALVVLVAASDLWRIGASYMPKCLTIAECRSDVFFSVRWIVASLIVFALQIAFFTKSRPR